MTAMPKFGISTSNPVDAAIEILEFGIVSRKPHIHPDGMNGTRSQNAARAIEGVQEVGGPLRFSPNLTEVAILWPWAVGASVNTGVYSLTEAMTGRYLTYDRELKVDTYDGCYVNSLEITAQRGQAWQWLLDVIGMGETIGNADTFPDLTITEDNPLALHHATMTLFGTAREFSEVTLRINNRLDAQAFNTDAVTSIKPGDTREVTLSCLVPYNSTNLDLRRCAVAGDDGVLAFTYGARSFSLALANTQFPRGAVETTVKGRKFLRLDGTVRAASDGTKEIIATLDNTP